MSKTCCGTDMLCVDSRPYGLKNGFLETAFVYMRARRYKCLACNRRIRTYEFLEEVVDNMMAAVTDAQKVRKAVEEVLQDREFGRFLKPQQEEAA